MELKDFIDFLENNITEEAFEAMALHFARQYYNIIGCSFDIRDNVKIYKLFRNYTCEECYLVVNFHNSTLDVNKYPETDYMIAENTLDTLMCLCDSLYLSDRIESRVPHCIKDICNCVFGFTKYPLKYFNYECRNKFFDHILNKHEKSENNYLKYLGFLFQRCKTETLDTLTACGLLLSKKDWNKKTNTVTLTYENGKTAQYHFRFEFDGMAIFCQKGTERSFASYIVDDTDIQRFKERVLKAVYSWV